jgi:hypothetical protein
MFSNNIRLTFINESGNVYKQQEEKIFHIQHPLESGDSGRKFMRLGN